MVTSFAPESRFAGLNTAIEVGKNLALALGLPLRVFTVEYLTKAEEGAATSALQAEVGDGESLVRGLPGNVYSWTDSDLWVATYWTTAHIIQMLCRRSGIDPRRVVYVVQDYEPNFNQWSTAAALAEETYHAGFTHVVNSEPLRAHLESQGVTANRELTFAPHLDVERLARVAHERMHRSSADPASIRIFFYSRPSKPRNLYELGVSALRIADARLRSGSSRELRGRYIEVASAGEASPRIGLRKIAERSAGKMTYEGYYSLLARSEVALTLMMSPHPSHPPLEVAVSGGQAITNMFGSARTNLHPNIEAVRPDPDHLATALINLLERSADLSSAGTFRSVEPGVLGDDFRVVLGRLRDRLVK